MFVLRGLLRHAEEHRQRDLVVARPHLHGADRGVERHPLHRVDELLLVDHPRLPVRLRDEIRQQVAVERPALGLAVVRLPELLRERLVLLRRGEVEQVGRRAVHPFRRVLPLRAKRGELDRGVLVERHPLVEPGGLRRLLEVDHPAAAGGHDHEVGLGRQDLGDVGGEVGLPLLPPRFADLLHLRVQLLEVREDRVGDRVAVLVVVACDPVLGIRLLRQPLRRGAARHLGVLVHAEDVPVPLLPGDLFALGEGHDEGDLLLLRKIRYGERHRAADRPDEEVDVLLEDELLRHRQPYVGLVLVVPGDELDLPPEDAPLRVDLPDLQLEPVEHVVGVRRGRAGVRVHEPDLDGVRRKPRRGREHQGHGPRQNPQELFHRFPPLHGIIARAARAGPVTGRSLRGPDAPRTTAPPAPCGVPGRLPG